MSLFANLTDQAKTTGDSLGGGSLLESAVYDFTIKMAYISTANSGAMAVNFHLETDDGQSLKEAVYITSGRDKGGKNTYERNGEVFFLPGYILTNDIALLTTDKALPELEADIEEKLVPIYNYDAQTEVPTKVPVIVPLLGKKVKLGVQKILENKSVKDESSGKYVMTAETRAKNTIDKAFHAELGVTVTEAMGGLTEPVFMSQWSDKFKGVEVNKVKPVQGGAPARPAGALGAGAGQAAAGAAPRPSLFKKPQ